MEKANNSNTSIKNKLMIAEKPSYSSKTVSTFLMLVFSYFLFTIVVSTMFTFASTILSDEIYRQSLPLVQAITQLCFAAIMIFRVWGSYKNQFKTTIKNFSKYFLFIIVFYILALFAVTFMANIFIEIIKAISGSTPPATSENQSSINETLRGTSLQIFGMFVLTAIAAPIFEELVFRVGIVGFFESLSIKHRENKIPLKIIGFLASASFFAIIHVASRGDWHSIGPYLASGIAFTGIYTISKHNMITVISVHSLWNIVIFINFFS